MLNKPIFTALSLLLIVQTKAMSANDDQLVQIDKGRNEALTNITERLIRGQLSPNAAKQLKVELDDVTKLESHAQEDHILTDNEIYNMSKCLEKVRSDIDSQTHKTKVWMGIDSNDKTIHEKISDALAAKRLDKEEAESLEIEYEKLRSREGTGYPISRMEYADAISIADDLQTLNKKIDQFIAGTENTH